MSVKSIALTVGPAVSLLLTCCLVSSASAHAANPEQFEIWTGTNFSGSVAVVTGSSEIDGSINSYDNETSHLWRITDDSDGRVVTVLPSTHDGSVDLGSGVFTLILVS
jgi:hypothetical protein